MLFLGPEKPHLLSISQLDSTSIVVNWSRGLTANGNVTAVYICGNNITTSKGIGLSDTSVVLEDVLQGCNCSVTIKVISYNKESVSDNLPIVTSKQSHFNYIYS